MNAKKSFEIGPANHCIPFVAATTINTTQVEQRVKNLNSFHAKYDVMLYMVEFIASFHLLDTENPSHAKEMGELKSLVAHARKNLGIYKTEQT